MSKNKKVIILEGPDGSGKTTLANQLFATMDAEYLKFGVPEPGDDLYKQYYNAIWSADQRDHVTVIDRLFLSEKIYGGTMRGKCRLSPAQMYALKDIASDLAIEVVCLPPWDHCLMNWLRRKEADESSEYLKIKQSLREVYMQYFVIAGVSPERYIRYDYTFTGVSVMPVNPVAHLIGIMKMNGLRPGGTL